VIHFTSSTFWTAYDALPFSIQKLADKNYELLKDNPKYPSLHLKQIKNYWSIRVGIHYRALAVEIDEGLLWFWIGSHSEYDKLIT
jgi:hypothetical protein